MKYKEEMNIFWFRRDLRLDDNKGLFEALNSDLPVLPIFIFDKNILDKLSVKDDARVSFIHNSLIDIKQSLNELGSDLHIFHGQPDQIWTKILKDYNVQNVYANEDYEPYAISRDKKTKAMLLAANKSLHTFKDHVIFEKNEVTKADGKPYTVYTPYKNKWYETLTPKISKVIRIKSFSPILSRSKTQKQSLWKRWGLSLANLPSLKELLKNLS